MSIIGQFCDPLQSLGVFQSRLAADDQCWIGIPRMFPNWLSGA